MLFEYIYSIVFSDRSRKKIHQEGRVCQMRDDMIPITRAPKIAIFYKDVKITYFVYLEIGSVIPKKS